MCMAGQQQTTASGANLSPVMPRVMQSAARQAPGRASDTSNDRASTMANNAARAGEIERSSRPAMEAANTADLLYAGNQAAKMDQAESYPVPNRAAKGDRMPVGAPDVVKSIVPEGATAPRKPDVSKADAKPAQYETGKSRSVTASKGDNLTRIAKREGVTVQQIIAANPQLKDPDKIRVGQSIFIPGG